MGVEDRYKKRREEEEKKQKATAQNSSEQKEAKSLYNGVENRFRAKNINTVASEISSRIDTWFKNNENYINNYNSRFQSVTGSYTDPYDADINDFISTVTKQKSNFDAEAASIKSIIEKNKDYLNPDYVNSVLSAFDEASRVQSDILNNSSEYGKYWSQWENEDAYKRYQKISSIIDMTSEQIKQYLGGDDPVAFTTDDGQEVTWDYLYNTKFYEELMSGEDFEEYSKLGASIKNPTYAEANGSDNWLGWKNPFVEGAEIGNIVTFSRDNIDSITKAIVGNDGKPIGPGDYRYQYMTDDEVAIYNYYLGKGDSKGAAEYLSKLDEALNARWGEQIADRVDSNIVSKLVFGLSAGLDQFVSGVQSIKNFITGDGAVAATPTQFASSIIREDLGTVGGVAYDLAQTTGNMLPSILVGNLAGSVAGTATMGVSAAGNGYNEMRKLGYNEWQARGYGLLVGASEATLQYAIGGIGKLGGKVTNNVISNIVSKFDNAIARVAIDLGGNMLSEGLEEAVQSVLEPAFKLLMTGEGYNVDWEEVFYSGLLGALSAGLLEGIPTIAGTASNSKAANKLYGDNVQDLVTESLEIDPENAHAQRMQARLDSGKNVSGYQINRLVEANESAMLENDVAKMQKAAEEKLTARGERGDVKKLAEIIVKAEIGEKLTRAETNALNASDFGRSVRQEMSRKSLNSDQEMDRWAENLNTDKINADVYGRMVAQIENEGASAPKTEAETQQVTGKLPASKTDFETDTNVGGKRAQETREASEGLTEVRETEGATYEASEKKDAQTGAVEAPEGDHIREVTNMVETSEGEHIADADKKVSETEEDGGVSLEAASAKYGAQAGAMVHTFVEGQDVAKYDAAYGVAYDMGRSGVNLSYAMQSEATAYLTESQRELAYEAGAAASKGAAEAQDVKNKAAINGKTGRRKGTVRGEGVTISDLKASFNDAQGTAYRVLSTLAEVTGIDIVLYKSEANAAGKFEGAQGRFKWSEDTIYIDINAGLADIKSVNDLAKYTMLRTFSHEFSHFLEKWNPIWYNELRKVVFDTISERGENVDELIAVKMEQTGLDYEAASREVVAEALTDILPDANFVEALASKHRNVFEKLLAKLKEFLANLKACFNTIGHASATREAKALKEQVGETVKYVESIVTLFDRVAVEAVESYQMTVATDIETNNTDGGITNVTERAEEGKGAETVHTGRDTVSQGEKSGTREEDGGRSRVSEEVGETDEGREEVYAGLKDNDDSWLTNRDNHITPAKGSDLHKAQQAFANEYGIECYVIKAEAWKRDNPATTHNEKVYVSESIDTDTLLTLVPHEGNHTMKQRNFQPYMEFIDRTPENLIIQTDDFDRLSDMVSTHRKIDIFDMTEEERTDLYDEMNSFVYGLYKSGIIDNADFNYGWVKGAFNDFDAYISELDAIHEQFKKENAPKKAAVTEITEVTAPEVNARSLEEREKEYKKKYSSWLKRANRQYVMRYGDVAFLSNGALGLKASEDMISFARSEFVGRIYETDVPDLAKTALDNAKTLLTEAPLEGALTDNTAVYVFNVDGKQRVFDKKHLSKLDGNLLYIGDFTREAKIIKAVDVEGNVVGFLLPMKVGNEVTATKPSKLKSFSSKFQSQINQEVTTNVEETGTVLPHRSDGERDSRLLAESQAEDVQGDGAERNPVVDAGERGEQTRRDDNRPDAEGTLGGSGEGAGESGDLRSADVLVTEEASEAAEKLHEEVTEVIAQRSTETPRGRNFVIGESLDLPNGEKARYKANVEAIRTVKQLEAEGRYATEAEQIILSKYVGWGGLANAFDQRKSEWAKEYTELKELLSDEEYASARGSTLNAHFTDISVIKAMYDGLAGLGFDGGRLLEPSSGVGNFVGAMPADMSAKVKSWTMVELDGITGLIAKYLYPNADVRIQGFEKTNIPNDFMDVAISNVPFGDYAITDKAYPKSVTRAIHNYFFAKSLDKVRPGGIVMFITSSYTMNSKDSAVRRYIMQRADLLGAIRLPDNAFKGNAGTEVVTDILVLKKRAANTEYAGEDFLEAPWTRLQNESYNGAYINSYFEAHPEMVLGTATMDGGMYRGGSLTYKALEGKGSLGDQIREAFKSIKGKMEYPATQSREKTNFAVERATKTTKENGLVVKDGKVYLNRGGELIEQTVAKGAAERISGMLEIRDAAKALMTYQQQGLNDSEIKKARTKLNRAYDAFVKKHGYINSQANRTAIKDDPDKFSIFALENYDPDTKKATKSDIFSKNTIAPNRTVTSAKDVAEGLIVSVNQTGGVDAALIARLTGKTEADVTRELIDTRKAFKNRNGALEAAEVYLSGNVRAKLRDAEALAPIDADYNHNIEALKSVIPADVGYQDIFVNAGTPWIPNSVYSDFAAYMLGGRNTEWRQDIDVTRNPETGNFTVELKNRYLKTNAANTQKWGTARRSFLELFDAMLNSKSVVVKDRLSDGSTVINKDATAAANEKIENIQKEFQDWLWRDEARRTELATLYNEIFNSVVTPKYNGDNLTVNGANAMKPLRPHQRDAVQRVISSGGNTLLAHKVGAGKTYEMAAAAMKLKELGLVKKPLFAVPKSLVAQWGNEFKDFFPTARLLVAEASDFTAANRKVFMNRIANGDYDAVIVSYEQFEKLPMSDDFTRELYQEQIDSVVAAIEEAKAEKGDKALSIKDLEKKRKSLQAKIDKLTDKAKDEDNISFEELGVDSLFVDEAHNFKNLFYTTSMTNVSGLGNKDGSKRAFDLYTKVRYLQQLNGGRGIVFATATPVMNSMSEMYIMQKYLQPDLINQLGLSTFDAWAKQFGEVVNGVEIKPSGQGYRVKQSFSRFKNMSELQLLFRNFADVLTDIPGLKIPKMKGGKVNVVVCEPGQFQQDYMKELEKRADNIRNVDPSEDNMLKITSDGRKISYTQRMIDPSLPYEEGSKIFRCADNVVKAYNESRDIKGTQLIFLDMATPKGKSNNETATEDIETDTESAQLYDDLKARLRSLGIPAKEIAFIHDADTDAKKKKLFADVNEGKVRVLIGSTGKMGVGMNAQKRVVAIHHLDAPWRPGDVEQRNGRAFRQGNINDEVECFTYVTEGSFDARLWDILERKQNFINQIMNGESVGREAEDTGEVTLSAAEVKALASGSPLIMEQVQLDTDIKKLESLYRAHLSAVRSAKERLLRDSGEIAKYEQYIEAGKADLSARVDTYSEGKFSITVGKTTFTDKKEAGAALMAAATAKATTTEYTTIGSFAGFKVRVIKTSEGIKGLLSGNQGYSFNTYPERPTYMITHLSAVAESIDEKVKLWQHNLEEARNDIVEQEKLIAEPFARQGELDQKRARYTEVMDILNPKEEQALEGVADDTVQEQSRAYLGDRDSDGNTLTEKQAEYFKDSKARDEGGNLLVLYHGTANAGFTVFEPSRGKFGGSWFTTSRKDADSYGGNYSHKLFDPNETDDIRTSDSGNYTLGSWMRFDTEADRAEFLRKYPNAEDIKTDAEYDALLNEAERVRDWDEYDRIEEEQAENRKELKRLQRAYGIYEWEHSREATIGELFENPERFTVSDVLRAWDAYDSNNAARDEEYTKEELIEGLRAVNEERIADGDGSFEEFTFKARIPVGEVGQIVNYANNRTYAVYANVTNPYIIDARQNTLAGANLYPTIEAGMNAAEYDGVIVRNARVGAHQETGDVVIIKESGQVKLTSNKTPTEHSDISYQQRTNTLTDREVLQMAAERLANEKKKVDGETVDALDEGEKAALEIFNKRLNALELLQEERAEQGRLYKEQQFGAKVDREAAAETLNRMHILDGKIKAANAEVLAVENKEILGRVLKKARRVVEEEQRTHDSEVFKRYVDRTKNAAAIKKYRERIKRDVKDLSDWITKPDYKDIAKHIPDALKDSVIPFLTSIDFTSKQQLRGGEATKADEEFVKRLNALNAALKKNIDLSGLYSGYNDLPPQFMDRLQDFIDGVRELVGKKSGEFVINKMTSEELRELASVVKVLKAYITQMNKFHANAMYQHVYEAGDNTIESLAAMQSDGGTANAVSNFVLWQQMRPAYAFERFGRGGIAIYDGLRRGQAQLAFNTKKIVEFTEKAYTDKEVKAWEKEIKSIKISAGIVKMRISDIMSFYELSKQPDSLRHMLGEGIRVATYTVNGKKISDNGHALTEIDIATIIGTLTDRQREVADALQKFMAEQGGAWGNYVSVKRFGEEQFTNEQYFPINSDGRHLQATADEAPSATSLYALLNMSFTKSRNEQANNRIIVYSIFDVFANHMASMAQYNAMALPVLDAIKWFNYQQKTEDAFGNRYVKDGVREQMDRVYGVSEETRPGRGNGGYAQSFVLNIIKAFNGTEAQGIPTDTFGMNATRQYNMAQVAYNLRVVAQQPLAITRAALLIDYGSIAKGLKMSPAAIRNNIAEMQKYSGIAVWKSLGFYDTNISRGLTDTIKHSSTVRDKIGDVGMWGAEKADLVTWAAMWSAAKEEVIKKQGLKPGADGFYEAVTKLFEDIIYKTQVVDSVLTKNEFMRSKGFFARAIGSFMSEPTTTASMVANAYDKYRMDIQRGMSRQQAWQKNGKLIGRTLYVYGITQTLLAAVTAVMDAWRDDDEYEEFPEKWLEAFGGNLVDELLPFNKLPILSDFYDLAKELLSVFGVDTYGNPPQSVFMQWYDSLIKGTEIIYDRITGEDTNYTWYGGIYKLLQAASGMTGLPMAAATREFVALWNNIIGAMAPSLKVTTYDSGEMNEIKYAYADGYLTDEEATALLLERGLVDNEDEAYFTIRGWEAGEGYSRYDAIYDAVLNGGDFDAAMAELTSRGYDEKDVISRVTSQIGIWYSDNESNVRISKQQAIGMLEKYTDKTDEEITKMVNRWSSKVVTGIAYDDIGDEFLEGNITASRASEMYMRYGSMTREEANKKVAVLQFVKDYPQFEAGDVSYSMVEGFATYGESAGIDVNVFYDVWKYNSGARADVDKKGNAISGSKKEKVLDYIDALPLSRAQKDSLYYALGWAESTIREAPWR